MVKKIKHLYIILAITLLFCMNLTGCKSRDTESVFGTGFYFDTVVSFTVYGTDDEQIIKELQDECARLEKIFSATDTESELYKLNNGETDLVSEDLYKCVQRALIYCDVLDGRYDISIRPVSELWNFKDGKDIIPDAKAIEEAVSKVNYRDIKLMGRYGDKYRIKLENGVRIDLGSAAKGYIGDKLIEYMEDKGIKSAIISLGGNVQCLGGKPGENGEYTDFKVAIKSPSTYSNEYSDVLNIKDRAVVTSGIYERCFEKDGVLYHHILDSQTGYPIDSNLASVSIVCKSGMDADILSTACFIAGYDETLEILEKSSDVEQVGGFEAEFIYKNGDVKKTAYFEQYR